MAITKPDVIIEQWCAAGTSGTDYIIPVQTSGDPDIMTQDKGIPVSMATPLNTGGIPVDRAQTNGYMRLYSSILAWIQAGGTFTFEPTVSAANTGYSIGTVLWAESKKDFVVSLINSNTFDFVTTPSYIDGIKWSTLTNIAFPDITDSAGLVRITGTSGLLVDYPTQLNGAVHLLSTLAVDGNVTTAGNMVVDAELSALATGPGAAFQILRSSTTFTPTQKFNIYTEGLSTIIPGHTVIAAIQLSGGTGNPGIFMAYSGSERVYNNSTPGDVDPLVHTQALATLGDIQFYRSRVEVFVRNDSAGNQWILTCTSASGQFPANDGVIIQGNGGSFAYPTGSDTVTIDLTGIITKIDNNLDGLIVPLNLRPAKFDKLRVFVTSSVSSGEVKVLTDVGSDPGGAESLNFFINIL